jgi:hypothetical protein
MKKFFLFSMFLALCSAFALADVSSATLVPAKHHVQRHHAHKAGKHRAPKHRHNRI